MTQEHHNEEVKDENLESTITENENVEETPVEEVPEVTVESVTRDWTDKYTRLAAEFDNYRKRVAKEKQDLMLNAGQDLMKALLEVVDDYDRASEQLEKSENVAALKEGVGLIFNKMVHTFKSKGLAEMESTGKEFNADLHEAIAEIPAPTPEMAGKVIDTVQKGYFLNDKIIRHAKVVVGKG